MNPRVVGDFETGQRRTLRVARGALQRALENEGVHFTEWNGGRSGITFPDEGDDAHHLPSFERFGDPDPHKKIPS